jgi:hypothetical protein
MPLVQQIVIYLGLVALNRWGVIQPLPAVTAHHLRVMLPISVSFLFYLVLGMLALWGVSIPMYASLRRFTVVFVMFFDFMISNLTHSQMIVATVAIQVVGCVMAAVNDIEYDPRGYIAIALYNASTAVYLVVIKHIKVKHDFLNSFSMMYLNSVMLIPVLFLASFFTGEIPTMRCVLLPVCGCFQSHDLAHCLFEQKIRASVRLELPLLICHVGTVGVRAELRNILEHFS